MGYLSVFLKKQIIALNKANHSDSSGGSGGSGCRDASPYQSKKKFLTVKPYTVYVI